MDATKVALSLPHHPCADRKPFSLYPNLGTKAQNTALVTTYNLVKRLISIIFLLLGYFEAIISTVINYHNH